MRYFKLTIAYDGTDFHGWQFQPGKPTIQGEVVGILRKLTQEHVQLAGTGRTDAGVHALGQVASFKTLSNLSANQFQHALNCLLPPSIRIVGAEEVGPEVSARFSARGKIYRYRIYRGRVVPPMIWRYVLHYPWPLDEDAMRVAAAKFVGVHDFTSFAASTGSDEDDKEREMKREIFSTELVRSSADDQELVFTVHGRSFFALHGAQDGRDALARRPRETHARRYRSPVRVARSLEIRPDRPITRLGDGPLGAQRVLPHHIISNLTPLQAKYRRKIGSLHASSSYPRIRDSICCHFVAAWPSHCG